MRSRIRTAPKFLGRKRTRYVSVFYFAFIIFMFMSYFCTNKVPVFVILHFSFSRCLLVKRKKINAGQTSARAWLLCLRRKHWEQLHTYLLIYLLKNIKHVHKGYRRNLVTEGNFFFISLYLLIVTRQFIYSDTECMNVSLNIEINLPDIDSVRGQVTHNTTQQLGKIDDTLLISYGRL